MLYFGSRRASGRWPKTTGTDANPRQLIGALGAAIGLGLAGWAWGQPSEASNAAAHGGGLLAGLGLALLAAPAFTRPARGPGSPAQAAGLGLAGAIACAALVWAFGHRHFGGFDHSVVIDLAWRLASGQRPYYDFVCTAPVGFMLLAGAAFKLAGPTWSALVGLQAATSAIAFAWSLALLRRLTGDLALAGLLAFAAQVATNIVTGYWWYNASATTMGILFFLSAAVIWREPANRAAFGSYVVSLALLASMKPNVAGLLIAGVTLALLASAAHRRQAIVGSLAAFGLFVVGLTAAGLRVDDMVRSYLGVGEHGVTLAYLFLDLRPDERAIALGLGAAVVLPWLAPDGWRAAGPGRWLGLAALVAGMAGYITNGEHKLVDLTLPLLASWWLVATGAAPSPRAKAWIAGLALVFLADGLAEGAIRYRIRGIGPFFDDQLAARNPAIPFFANLRGSDELNTVVDDLNRLDRAFPTQTLFFGPRMQWAYAALRRPSPAGQPVWWHKTTGYPASREPELTAAWEASRQDVVVLWRGDTIHLPYALRASVGANYRQVPGFDALWVGVRTRE